MNTCLHCPMIVIPWSMHLSTISFTKNSEGSTDCGSMMSELATHCVRATWTDGLVLPACAGKPLTSCISFQTVLTAYGLLLQYLQGIWPCSMRQKSSLLHNLMHPWHLSPFIRKTAKILMKSDNV